MRTAPARLVAGLAARRRADAGPLTVVSCDNLPDNGAVARRVVRDLAQLVDPDLAEWIAGRSPSSPPWSTGSPPHHARRPCAPWLTGTGPTTAPGRHRAVPRVGAQRRVPRRTAALGGRRRHVHRRHRRPFEHRKLWLLNGAHSLLAYAGSVTRATRPSPRRWPTTPAGAGCSSGGTRRPATSTCPADEVDAYRAALLDRFANPRMHHRLAQIAADGSQKLPVRILPVLRAERAAGRLPEGAARVLAAWVCHLRGAGVPVDDVRAEQVAALADRPARRRGPRVLDGLDRASGGRRAGEDRAGRRQAALRRTDRGARP